jgi:periplasmic divalent cation tolerance protein
MFATPTSTAKGHGLFSMANNALIVLVTTPDRKLADKIAQVLIEEKLAACVNILPEVYSRYWWRGRIENDRELLLIIKTLKSRFKALQKRVLKLHAYEAPEILALPVAAVNPTYLKWLSESIKIRK